MKDFTLGLAGIVWVGCAQPATPPPGPIESAARQPIAQPATMPRAPFVDQAQLVSEPGFYTLAPSGSVGQTFVAGTTGRMTGVEVAIGACQTAPGDTVELQLV